MTPYSVDAQIIRLRNLWIETASPQTRQIRRLTEDEHAALATILDELHRLHVAIAAEVAHHRETRERRKKGQRNRRSTHDLNTGRPAAPGKKVRA